MQKESSVVKTKSLNEDHFPDNGGKIEQEIQEELQSPADSNLPPAPRSPKWLSAILLPPPPSRYLACDLSLSFYLSIFLSLSRDTYAYITFFFFSHSYIFLAFTHSLVAHARTFVRRQACAHACKVSYMYMYIYIYIRQRVAHARNSPNHSLHFMRRHSFLLLHLDHHLLFSSCSACLLLLSRCDRLLPVVTQKNRERDNRVNVMWTMG